MEETRRSLRGEYEERQREVKDLVMRKEARLADRLRAASDDHLDEIRRQEGRREEKILMWEAGDS